MSTDRDTDSVESPAPPPERDYDRTGFYPKEGKQFHVWGILFFNIGVIVVIAAVAALINHFVLG